MSGLPSLYTEKRLRYVGSGELVSHYQFTRQFENEQSVFIHRANLSQKAFYNHIADIVRSPLFSPSLNITYGLAILIFSSSDEVEFVLFLGSTLCGWRLDGEGSLVDVRGLPGSWEEDDLCFFLHFVLRFWNQT